MSEIVSHNNGFDLLGFHHAPDIMEYLKYMVSNHSNNLLLHHLILKILFFFKELHLFSESLWTFHT
jgi:hypothetical protein